MDFQSYQAWASQDMDPSSLSPSNWSSSSCNQSLCLPKTSVALTMVSSVGAVVGSLLIICTFLCWKDLRTIARMILVFLAIADLFTGLGYLFGAAVYIHYYTPDYCDGSPNASNPTNLITYKHLCTAQSFFTTLMPIASFFWTANLAIYLFFSIAWQKPKFTKTLMGVFHTVAWGIPLLTCVVLVSKGNLGPSESRSSGGWCWISHTPKSNASEFDVTLIVIELMAGKVWEIGVCVVALVACIGVRVVIWRRFRHPKVSPPPSTSYLACPSLMSS